MSDAPGVQLHANQLTVSAETVRALVDEQFPEWRLESEAAAARELVGRTRFPTPEPVAPGEPGAGYPLPWSVQTWLPGVVATDEDPSASVAFAHDLAEFRSEQLLREEIR